MQKELIIAAVNVIILSEVKLPSFVFSSFLAFLWFKVFRITFDTRLPLSVLRWNPFGQLCYRTLVFCSSLDRFETVVESQRTLHLRLLVAIFPACARFFWPSCLQRELCLALMRQWLRFPWSRYPRAGACPRYLDVGTSSGMFRDVFAFPINNAETIKK